MLPNQGRPRQWQRNATVQAGPHCWQRVVTFLISGSSRLGWIPFNRARGGRPGPRLTSGPAGKRAQSTSGLSEYPGAGLTLTHDNASCKLSLKKTVPNLAQFLVVAFLISGSSRLGWIPFNLVECVSFFLRLRYLLGLA